MRLCWFVWFVLHVSFGLSSESSPNETSSPPVEVSTVPYVVPSTEGLDFAETFDGDLFSRWVKSAGEKYKGKWEQARRRKEAIAGDLALKAVDESQFHGIATKLPKSFSGKPLVVSYEAKFEDDLSCGGGYLKLFHTSSLSSLTDFNADTNYAVMFGPDRCGATSKVHVIIKQRSPITGKWAEHHLADAPRFPQGQDTHVYTLVIKPDDTYEVLVDRKVEKSGNLKSDFEPPFTPPKEVSDPEDQKPEDWIDSEYMPDPSASKPDDWDETQPKMISDPEAVMPVGWLVDEPRMMQDPDASKPGDWSDEEDGEWNAPMIKNPLCTVGCGEWTPPSVPNPKYRGIWQPPMVKDPNYKGDWKPRLIPNSEYFESPHTIADFDAVGFEIWTVQKDLLFDNIVISRSVGPVNDFIDKTWKVRHEIEVAQAARENKQTHSEDSAASLKNALIELAMENPAIAVVCGGMFGFGLLLILVRLMRSKARTETPSAPNSAEAEKSSKGKDDPKESEEEEELKGKQTPEPVRQRRIKKD